MAAINGFFGNIQGPFAADEELFTKIQSEVKTLLNIYLNWEFIMLETLI